MTTKTENNMKMPRWHRLPMGTTDELLETMKAQGVDHRLLKTAARFIADPRQLPADRVPTLVAGLTPGPLTPCFICSDPLDMDTAHTVEIDNDWREVHPECCPFEPTE